MRCKVRAESEEVQYWLEIFLEEWFDEVEFEVFVFDAIGDAFVDLKLRLRTCHNLLNLVLGTKREVSR